MSGTTNPTATNPTAGASGGAATGGTGTGTGASATGTAPATGGSAPSEIVIHYQTFTSDNSWPPDLILDRRKSNWLEWDRRLNIIADQRCFSEYLDGTLPCPDPAIHAQSAMNWKRSDRALRGFILEHISERDYETASVHTTSQDIMP